MCMYVYVCVYIYIYTHSYQGLVGREERAWFTETNHKHRQTVGHTKGYAKVIVAQDDGLLNKQATRAVSKSSNNAY